MDKKNKTEERRFIRHPMCFPLTYKVINREVISKKENRSTTLNISRGGLLFSAKRPVEINQCIAIKIPFQDKIFKVEAKVVHCNKSLETNLFNIGVSFRRLNDAFKIKLIEQMYLISEYRDLKTMQTGKDMSIQDASREWIRLYSKRFKRLYW